jgi:hypothetical protein
MNNNWISTKTKLPEKNTQVNVVWINRKPVAYYADIKDKPFVSSAVYYQGNWYWWSVIVEELIDEYGCDEYGCEAVRDFKISEDIAITHWMPLPEPPKE